MTDKQKLAKAVRDLKAFRRYMFKWAPEVALDRLDARFAWLLRPVLKHKQPGRD